MANMQESFQIKSHSFTDHMSLKIHYEQYSLCINFTVRNGITWWYNTTVVTCLVSLCLPSLLSYHQVHQGLVVRVHPSLQVGQPLVHLFDLVDQASLARRTDHLYQAVRGHPVIHIECEIIISRYILQ